jgi:transcriptional regulator with XRE-family HTH domain
MPGRRREVEVIPREQAAIVGANIRALRTGKGWTQAHIGELMGWISNSTVCAAEGRRGGRQRNFTTDEVERLADFFGIKAWQLTTRCMNCEGNPPAGFACLTCGAGAIRTAREHAANCEDTQTRAQNRRHRPRAQSTRADSATEAYETAGISASPLITVE